MEIHKDFIETLWKESPSYSTVKNRQQSLKERERERERERKRERERERE